MRNSIKLDTHSSQNLNFVTQVNVSSTIFSSIVTLEAFVVRSAILTVSQSEPFASTELILITEIPSPIRLNDTVSLYTRADTGAHRVTHTHILTQTQTRPHTLKHR